MVVQCSIKNCKSLWNPNSDITFHRFPKNENRRKKWLQAIPAHLIDIKSTFSRICSIHFLENCFKLDPSNKKKLYENAIPTIFDIKRIPLQEIQDCGNISGSVNFNIVDNIVAKQNKGSLTNDISTQTYMRNDIFSSNYTMFKKTVLRRLKLCEEKIKNLEKKRKIIEEEDAKKEKKKRKVIQDMREDKNNKSMETKNMKKEDSKHEEDNYMTVLQEAVHKFISTDKRELFWNELQYAASSSVKPCYSDSIKEFAMTLYFYSPKAYEFIRQKITLPHSATLRKWLASHNCDPGLLQGPLLYLQQAVKEEQNNYLKNVGLIIDAMAIRSQLSFDESRDRVCGKVDYGGVIKEDKDAFAKEALVFLIVSYSKKFKLPIAYFLINGASAAIQCTLLQEVIKQMYNIGITIRSITCDGTETNFSTMRILGCNLKLHPDNTMKTYFSHPSQEDIKVYFIADPAHMIKLCRNTFMEKIITSRTGKICNTFVRKMHALQEKNDFKLSNKLSNEHMQYYKRKMNVRLAVQTISSSVADAINYLKSENYSDFIGSEATVEFLRIFDRLFDMMNSRNTYGKHFKSPMHPQNLPFFEEVFFSSRQYIQSLEIDNINILQHQRKTFALGFIINTFSFYNLASDLFTQNIQKYFLTYKCSQDHLELTFACIRNRGGWNNNPHCLQFKWALRQLLFKNSIKPTKNTNCSTEAFFESIPILACRKHGELITNDNHTAKDIAESKSHLEKLSDLMESHNVNCLQQNILYYITGCLVHRLLLQIECKHCHIFLLKEANTNIDHCYTKDKINRYSMYTTFINRGKLCFPSDIAYNIVLTAEKAFMSEKVSGNLGMPNFKKNLIAATINKLGNTILFDTKHPVLDNTGEEDLHEIQILKALVSSYSKCRIKSHLKKSTENYIGNRINTRQQLTKTVLFYNV